MADRIEQILKTITTFDVENDFGDRESKENLANLFAEVITSDDDSSLEFINALIPAISDIMADLGLGEPPSEELTDVEDEDEVEPEETPEDDDVAPEEAALENNNIDIKLVENANNYIYQ